MFQENQLGEAYRMTEELFVRIGERLFDAVSCFFAVAVEDLESQTGRGIRCKPHRHEIACGEGQFVGENAVLRGEEAFDARFFPYYGKTPSEYRRETMQKLFPECSSRRRLPACFSFPSLRGRSFSCCNADIFRECSVVGLNRRTSCVILFCREAMSFMD